MTTLDTEELHALYEMLQDGVPTIVGRRGEKMPLPESLYNVRKEAVKNLKMGLPVSVIAEEEQLGIELLSPSAFLKGL